MDKARSAAARKMVEEILQGRISPKTHPRLFDDDVVYINVGILEQLEPDWLLQELANSKHALQQRQEIARNMSGARAEQARRLVQLPD